MTEVIQVKTTKTRATNRGLRAYELTLIILEEEGRLLTANEISELCDYPYDTIRKACKKLARDCKISYREVSKKGEEGKGRICCEYFILAKEGLELVVPIRRVDKRSYVSKIIPNYQNKSMTLELNKTYSEEEEATTYEVEWIKRPIHEKMTFQVSTCVMDRNENNKLRETGLSLNVFIKDEEGNYSNRSTIKVYFKEAI